MAQLFSLAVSSFTAIFGVENDLTLVTLKLGV